MREITRDHFRKATGSWPEQDDLERCNCMHAGGWGHLNCGWDKERNLPNFWPKHSAAMAIQMQSRFKTANK
jgi:hypothetical protein